MQAFMWAFKPTDVVDIRYFPRQEQKNIREEIARLTDKPDPEKKLEPPGAKQSEPSRSEPTL
jgi:hypothetical protein